MKVGEIMKCEEYNNQCKSRIMLFLTPQYNYRRYGYVGKIKENTIIWRKTKKEIKKEIQNMKIFFPEDSFKFVKV
jgi:hypothetical protein